jgi:hypothetical protein
MKALIAGLLTAAVLAAMLFLGSRKVATTPPTDPQGAEAWSEPAANPAEEAVRALIRSCDEGDVTGYLEAFAGPIRARVEREVASRGREAFADDLRRAAGARKGHAVFAAEPDGDDDARVAVETVYPDRNERQTYRVVKSGEGWRVTEVATVRSRQPAARFGASANPSTSETATPQVPPPPKVGLTVETGNDPESP